MIALQPSAVNGNHLNPYRNLLAALFYRLFYHGCQAAAAGYLHTGNGNRTDVIVLQDRRQLDAVIHIVQLGTANYSHMVTDKFRMEIAIGIGSAICGNQQVTALEIRCVGCHQLELHRPHGQLAGNLACGRFRSGRHGMHAGTRTSGLLPLCHMLLDCLRIIGQGFLFDKGNGTGGTVGQAVSQSVTIILPQQDSLAVFQPDCPLMARMDTQSAAVAFFLIYGNNSSFHLVFLLSANILLLQ